MRQYQNLSGSGPCHAQILDAYYAKVALQAKERDVFYLTPNKFTDHNEPWYSLVPVGRNCLSSMLKHMCAEAQVSGNFTNHSLRSYGATTSYSAKLSERVIQERISHRCLKALRQYERTLDSQLLEVSNIISLNKVQAATLSSVPCSEPKMEIRDWI